jgi:hypothetical protein
MERWTDILLVCVTTGVIIFWKDVAGIFRNTKHNKAKKS